MALLPGIEPTSGATFSPCGHYRYHLWRIVNPAGRGRCLFVMLNPSTADENVDDPTIRRGKSFAKAWGYRTYEAANLFALRSTKPKALYQHRDPVGPDNDAWLSQLAKGYVPVSIRDAEGVRIEWQALGAERPRVLCAWGKHGELMGRGAFVRDLFREAGAQPHYLRLLTGSHPQPGHPLYMPGATSPKPWDRCHASGRNSDGECNWTDCPQLRHQKEHGKLPNHHCQHDDWPDDE